MKICYQLWSVNDLVNETSNIDKIFSKLSEIGYDGIELFKFDNQKTLEEVLFYAKEYNLEIISSHLDFELLRDNPAKCIENLEKINITDIVIPYIGDISINEESMNKRLNEIKEIKSSLPSKYNLYYHNHNMECKKIDNKYVLEHIGKVVPLEFDTYWLLSTGLNPCTCLKELNNSPLIHFKDIKVINDENGEYKVVDCQVGVGNMELRKIIDACFENNIESIIVEQETNAKAIDKRFEDMELSYKNIMETINESINNK